MPEGLVPPQAPRLDSVIAGRYRVVRQIGRGGMGVVLEAENLVTLKRVAIKCLHPLLAGRDDSSARLLREARAAARVRHPHVVDVYDVVGEEGMVYLVMELLEGETLSKMLERGGLPLHAIVGLLLDAIRGVAAAHARGVIHRDIKPDNIFLVEVPGETARVVKVLDFGISKLDATQPGPSLSTSGVVGTPMYMSYEQLSNVPDIDARSDVYAFGVILYEAMTGRRPYEADNFPQLVLRIVQSEPVPPRQLQPALPKALESVIVRAMAKDRTQRIPSLTVLARELEPFASEAMFQAQHSLSQPTLPHALPAALDTTLSRASSVAQPSAAASRTRLRALLALAAALVTGAVIATRYLRDTEGPTDPPQPSAAGGVPDEPAGRALIPAANVPAKQTRSPDLPSQLSTSLAGSPPSATLDPTVPSLPHSSAAAQRPDSSAPFKSTAPRRSELPTKTKPVASSPVTPATPSPTAAGPAPRMGPEPAKIRAGRAPLRDEF